MEDNHDGDRVWLRPFERVTACIDGFAKATPEAVQFACAMAMDDPHKRFLFYDVRMQAAKHVEDDAEEEGGAVGHITPADASRAALFRAAWYLVCGVYALGGDNHGNGCGQVGGAEAHRPKLKAVGAPGSVPKALPLAAPPPAAPPPAVPPCSTNLSAPLPLGASSEVMVLVHHAVLVATGGRVNVDGDGNFVAGRMSPLACAKRAFRSARARAAAATPGSDEATDAQASLASAQEEVTAAADDDDADGAGVLRAAPRARLASFRALARAVTPEQVGFDDDDMAELEDAYDDKSPKAVPTEKRSTEGKLMSFTSAISLLACFVHPSLVAAVTEAVRVGVETPVVAKGGGKRGAAPQGAEPPAARARRGSFGGGAESFLGASASAAGAGAGAPFGCALQSPAPPVPQPRALVDALAAITTIEGHFGSPFLALPEAALLEAKKATMRSKSAAHSAANALRQRLQLMARSSVPPSQWVSVDESLTCVRALIGFELVADASRDCAAAFTSFSTALNEIVPVVAS